MQIQTHDGVEFISTSISQNKHMVVLIELTQYPFSISHCTFHIWWLES